MELIKDLGLKRPTENYKHFVRRGLYRCHCGKEIECTIAVVKAGRKKDCGCMHFHGLTKTSLHSVWGTMRNRCTNPNVDSYKYYKDIPICDEWKKFVPFYKWALENGYKEGLEIDRIKINLGYSPDNCRFVTHIGNAQNTRLIIATNTTGFRGVYRMGKKWQSSIRSNRKMYYLGTWNTKEEAAQAYNNFIIEHKTLHPLNIIPCQQVALFI